jgi:hypothetical protein
MLATFHLYEVHRCDKSDETSISDSLILICKGRGQPQCSKSEVQKKTTIPVETIYAKLEFLYFVMTVNHFQTLHY